MKYYEISAFNDKDAKNIFEEECKNFIDNYSKNMAKTTVLKDIGSSNNDEYYDDDDKHTSCITY